MKLSKKKPKEGGNIKLCLLQQTNRGGGVRQMLPDQFLVFIIYHYLGVGLEKNMNVIHVIFQVLNGISHMLMSHSAHEIFIVTCYHFNIGSAWFMELNQLL